MSSNYVDEENGFRSIPFRYVWPAELDLMARLAGLRLLRAFVDRARRWRDTGWTMSQDNVALFRCVTDAYNRREVEAFLDLAHPEVEWHPAFQVLLGGQATVYRGHDGMRQMFREVDEALSAIDAEWLEVRDLGERIVATGRLHIRGRESGAETEASVAAVVDFTDGKVSRVQTYLDADEALKAAGLRN